MVTITLSDPIPSTVPADGWKVEYRIKGTTGAYIVPVGSPFSSFPIVFSTTDPAGTLYEGHLWRDCGDLESIKFNWVTGCDCTGDGDGYVVGPDGSNCRKTTTIDATVTSSGYCLAPTGYGVYTAYGSRIYNPGFSLSDVLTPFGGGTTYIYAAMSSSQWANTGGSLVAGPMNRRAVWIDSDCDGNPDALSVGVQTTIAFMYNNTGPSKTVYVGVAADNQFKLVVNGVIIIDTGSSVSDLQFKIFHIFPVVIPTGVSYFNAIATGDGTVNDAMAMVGFDNTNLQIKNATSDSQLNILFDSKNLRGSHYDVATCPADYSMDTSGGSGHYTCVKVEIAPCNNPPA